MPDLTSFRFPKIAASEDSAIYVRCFTVPESEPDLGEATANEDIGNTAARGELQLLEVPEPGIRKADVSWLPICIMQLFCSIARLTVQISIENKFGGDGGGWVEQKRASLIMLLSQNGQHTRAETMLRLP